MNSSIDHETTAEYIERVGTAFAVAQYRARRLELQGKSIQVREIRDRLSPLLESHFESPEEAEKPAWDDDETMFEAAFEHYAEHFRQQAEHWQALEHSAFSHDCPGTEPGTQAQLDAMGIKISLADIEFEIERSGNVY
jgi:hypothetical protein